MNQCSGQRICGAVHKCRQAAGELSQPKITVLSSMVRLASSPSPLKCSLQVRSRKSSS